MTKTKFTLAELNAMSETELYDFIMCQPVCKGMVNSIKVNGYKETIMKNSKDLKSYKANIKSYFKEIVNQYAEKYPYYIMTETLKKAYRVYFTKKFEHLISNEQIEDVYNNPWMSYNATEYIADINRHIYNEWLKMHITRLIKNSNKDNMIDVVTNNIFETFECWPK